MKVSIEYPLYTVDAAGEDVETIYTVECELTPEEKETPRTFNDGGSLGAPAQCEILTVKLAGVEVKYWDLILDKGAQKEIEEKAFQKASDDEEHAKDAWAEAQNDSRVMERIQDREDYGFHD